MRQFINGQEYEIPMGSDGRVNSDTIRRAAGIAKDRAIIVQRSDGRNELLNPGQGVEVLPGEHFRDAPIHTRG
jgi:hypothetical protein